MKKTLLVILSSVVALALPTASFGQVAPPLGAASSFVLFTAVGAFDNVGPSFVSGNIGTNAGAFSGFPLGVQLTGTINVANTLSTQAATDVQTAYGLMAAIPCVTPLAGLGGPPANPQVLLPGEYCLGQLTTLAGNLILDAQNNPNATFFIRVGGALITGEGSTVTLINGASASNVYWQVGGRVDMGRISVFQGTLIADGAINMIEGASLVGRGLSRGGAITLDTNTASLAVVTSVAWTGLVSTDWFTANNWSPNTVPTSSIDATIPAGRPRYPILTTGTAFAAQLNLNTGGSLTQTGGTLDVATGWANNGTFTATGGLVNLSRAFVAINDTTRLSAEPITGSSPSRFWNLSVQAAGANQATSTNPGGVAVQRLLTLVGSINTNNNPFTLLSDANGQAMIYNNGGILRATSGANNVTVQRYISPSSNAGVGYRHLSTPVTNMNFQKLTVPGTFTPVVNAAYNTDADPANVTPYPTVYSYNQNRIAAATNNLTGFNKGWQSPAALTAEMISGVGYTVNVAPTTISFVGLPNNAAYAQSMDRGTDAEAGWQLVGNPYPAPIAFNRILAGDRPNLDNSFYTFESSSQYAGSYRAYVNGIGGDSIIAVGQGFFVRVSTPGANSFLAFHNYQRRTQYTDRTVRRGAATARPLVQLDLQGAGLTDPLYVYFENGATAGTDTEFDAVKLPNTNGLNLSAVGTDNLAISGLPLPGAATVTVPLHLGVPATGTYTLNAAQLLNLTTTHAYLRDLQTGALTDLSTTPSYTFQLNAAYTGVRFELVFTSQAALAVAPATLSAQVAMFPNPAHAAMFVELPATLRGAATTATLLDGLGRPVRSFVLPAGVATHSLPLGTVAAGVYSLRLSTTQGVVTKKLLIN
jgi:hypothetical protein